jgi:hypothetical protein
MTPQDLEIILKYLAKTVVPQADHDAFFLAVERLRALQIKVLNAA